MRYFFDVTNSTGWVCDNEGDEFSFEDEAVKEAVIAARELASERVLLGEPLAGWTLVVRDGSGNIIRTLRLTRIVQEAEHGFPLSRRKQTDLSSNLSSRVFLSNQEV